MKGDQCKNKMNFPNGITNGYSWYPLKGELLFICTIFLMTCTQRGQLVLGDLQQLSNVDQSSPFNPVSLSSYHKNRGGDESFERCSDTFLAAKAAAFIQMLVQRFPAMSQNTCQER